MKNSAQLFVRVDGKDERLKPLLYSMAQFLNLTENESLNLLLYIRKINKLSKGGNIQ